MAEGPDIVRVAGLVGDPARSAMLLALLDGRAHTATELAGSANVTRQTASAHLARLLDAALLRVVKQGRHRYFALCDDDVAALLERLLGVAARGGAGRLVAGPTDPALRRCRVCYDHLAGAFAVELLDALLDRGWLRRTAPDGGDDALCLTDAGRAGLGELGLPIATPRGSRRPLCRPCLDWSERRSHLAGTLGAAILDRCLAAGWMARVKGSRAVSFEGGGEGRALAALAGRERAPVADAARGAGTGAR